MSFFCFVLINFLPVCSKTKIRLKKKKCSFLLENMTEKTIIRKLRKKNKKQITN